MSGQSPCAPLARAGVGGQLPRQPRVSPLGAGEQQAPCLSLGQVPSVGGDRECSSPSLGLNHTAWPARPDSRGGQGWDQHSPLALRWALGGVQGVPGRDGIPEGE